MVNFFVEIVVSKELKAFEKVKDSVTLHEDKQKKEEIKKLQNIQQKSQLFHTH